MPAVMTETRNRRWRWWLTIALSAAWVGMEGVSFVYVRAFRSWRSQLIAEENAQSRQYRRVSLHPMTVAKSASTIYMDAFRLVSINNSQQQKLHALASGVDAGGASSRLKNECAAAVSAFEMADAFDRCEWGLSDDLSGALFDEYSRAIALADCLGLEGREAESVDDLNGAAAHYFDALTLASDLSVGNQVMAVTGVSAFETGVAGLIRIVKSPHIVREQLEYLQGGLVAYEEKLPSLEASLRLERIQLAQGIENEARQGFFDGGVSGLLPWHVPIAWHVRRNRRALDMLAGIGVRDAAKRHTFETSLDRAVDTGDSPMLKAAGMKAWSVLAARLDRATLRFHAVRGAVDALITFSGANQYPPNLDALTPPAVRQYSLEYMNSETHPNCLNIRSRVDTRDVIIFDICK